MPAKVAPSGTGAVLVGVSGPVMPAYTRPARSQNTRPAGAASLLREGLDLWRDPAYAGLTDCPPLGEESARLEELRLEAGWPPISPSAGTPT
ncbi:hypothetical protein E1267_03950 [Nonomuraea longispora]|uniref:Bacterial transcriptional activator domain-containing protein n=1 Tax=Nonomuraea longispora TaxID=1848320 RepID=A0A4R4NM66_9ACTN|nr:hypothetical protein E1267_03950 [Nonomuraea longispora]